MCLNRLMNSQVFIKRNKITLTQSLWVELKIRCSNTLPLKEFCFKYINFKQSKSIFSIIQLLKWGFFFFSFFFLFFSFIYNSISTAPTSLDVAWNLTNEGSRFLFIYLFILIGKGSRYDNFFPPRLTRPSPLRPERVFLPRKGGGARMGQDFSPAPRGGVGMGLEFLDPPRPAPPRPCPAPRC